MWVQSGPKTEPVTGGFDGKIQLFLADPQISVDPSHGQEGFNPGDGEIYGLGDVIIGTTVQGPHNIGTIVSRRCNDDWQF